jgi:hypothetical protein
VVATELELELGLDELVVATELELELGLEELVVATELELELGFDELLGAIELLDTTVEQTDPVIVGISDVAPFLSP